MKNPMTSDEARWTLVAASSALVAGVVTRNILKQGWRVWRDDDPPNNPADPEVTWTDALAWAGVTGMTIALARVVARRGAAAGWRKLKGGRPPR